MHIGNAWHIVCLDSVETNISHNTAQGNLNLNSVSIQRHVGTSKANNRSTWNVIKHDINATTNGGTESKHET